MSESAVLRMRVGFLAGMALVLALPIAAQADWPQWGGPDRNFVVHASGLAESWPEEGPRKIWHRELGDGYSTIISEGGVLYTMYRKEKDEYAVALDAQTGKTLWEQKNPSPFTETMSQFGPGPHSSPLVYGELVYTIGTNMVLRALDKKTGHPVWSHDLVAEYDAEVPRFGYACSPLAYKHLIIVPVGVEKAKKEGDGEDKTPAQALMAFDCKTGNVVWRSQEQNIGYSSPMVVNWHGGEQVVCLLERALIGLDPNTGKLIWEHSLGEDGGISMPLWLGDGKLLCFSGDRTRLIQLAEEAGKISAKEVWASRKMRIPHANALLVSDCIVGCSGDDPSFMVCLDVATGNRKWIERGFAKSTCLYADGKVVALDENGMLSLARVSAKGYEELAKHKVAERYSWAAPTLVGKTLYVRDRKHIMALDLG